MKQLLLIMFLFCGLVSFNSNESNTIIETEELIHELWEVESVSFVNAEGVVCCTATATYNGVGQASFQCCGMAACDCAQMLACNYIISQGGSCPQHQQ
ncbi:hypothetical protein ULMS_10840 [Patiriisocius marinistellae]|uniref:Uncharacterized protein n=1 Tax=Patiriisocius marinistellae TaxID=2494560 RepID=A0A5J4FZG5_9FLAO|nr:hypothetical protein [Patiriisocius marinistellae]GEQ85576.1 hypothetical protein ULMS_10840 [Patiriisocius marinistellae]